jgi:hypothetical protein
MVLSAWANLTSFVLVVAAEGVVVALWVARIPFPGGSQAVTAAGSLTLTCPLTFSAVAELAAVFAG